MVPWPFEMEYEGFARELSEQGAMLQPSAMGDAGRGGGGPAASPVWSVAEGAESVFGRYAQGAAIGRIAFSSIADGRRLRVFFGGISMGSALIREVCRRMGVPVFLETPDAFQAGNGVAVIHADGSQGIRTIRFPNPSDVLDVFTWSRYQDIESLRLEMPPKTTRILFFDEKAAMGRLPSS